jgi:hypothetical protein
MKKFNKSPICDPNMNNKNRQISFQEALVTEVIEASIEALDSVKDCFHTVNTAKMFSRPSQETQEQRL